MNKKSFYLRKVVAIAISLAAMTMFSACGDKEDDNGDGNGASGNIVGVWEYSDYEIVNIKWNSLIPSEYYELMESQLTVQVEAMFGDKMECTSDGKIDFGDEYYVSTYELDGNNITIHEDGKKFYGTYTVTGNKLQVNLDVVKSLPEVSMMCDVFVMGLIFNRVGDSARSASVADEISVSKEKKGFLKTMVSSLKY